MWSKYLEGLQYTELLFPDDVVFFKIKKHNEKTMKKWRNIMKNNEKIEKKRQK